MNTIQVICVWALPILFAITLHEAAHGWAALLCGDDTAARLGRVSLNPLKHIELFGTIILPIILLSLGGIILGWAKPVPVTWSRLRHPRADMAWVALAGPMANLLMAFAWAMVLKMSDLIPHAEIALAAMGHAGIQINVLLLVFNLLPIPPLDGSRVLMAVLPSSGAKLLAAIEPYGFIIILVAFMTKFLGMLISGPYMWLQQALLSLV